MSKFPVSPKKEKDLLDRMEKWKVFEDDLKETFVRAQGQGGQKVNKTASCVMLYHAPTRFRVKCQVYRTRALNRYLARRILLEKIEERELGRESEKQKKREKIRRQKRKRSKRAKEKILEQKKQQSSKKQLRKPPKNEE